MTTRIFMGIFITVYQVDHEPCAQHPLDPSGYPPDDRIFFLIIMRVMMFHVTITDPLVATVP